MKNKKIILTIPILVGSMILNAEDYLLSVNKSILKDVVVSEIQPESQNNEENELISNPNSCLDILNSGQSTGDGNYTVYPDGSTPLNVYCDMTVDGGGWTLVYYSNSDSVSRDLVSNSDWNVGANINFSYLYSFRNMSRNGRYEFFIHDSSTIFRHVIFSQTNAYNEDPVGNDYNQTGGNFYYADRTDGWQGLSLGTYGNEYMENSCTLSMAYEANHWWFCLQDQREGIYGTGPWFNDTSGVDENSQQWERIYQR